MVDFIEHGAHSLRELGVRGGQIVSLSGIECMIH